MSITFDRAAKVYSQALLDRNAGVFAGAGLSIPLGFVSWKLLLKEVAAELNLDIDRVHDLTALAQFHVNETGSRAGINQTLVDEFLRTTGESDNHRLLAKLPIESWWTTNYDPLIENSLSHAGKVVEVKRRPADLTTTRPGREAIVYKMHGDVTEMHGSVLVRDDYEQYDEDRGLFKTALAGDLVQKTFLFIGFSFDDPNIGYVLSNLRVALRQSQRQHFYLLKKAKESDFKDYDDPDSEFRFAKHMQEHRVRDLSRYGIRTVLLDDYSEVTQFLQKVYDNYRRNSIFVSGAVDNFDPFGEKAVQEFTKQLSYKLVSEGKFRIVSGFGKGIGPSIINGTFDAISNNRLPLDRYLLPRPFPFHITNAAERIERYRAYREEMMDEAGIAIFIFGNKKEKSKIIPSNGVLEEYEIAKSKGIVCIAVGATGSMSKKISAEINKDLPPEFTSPDAKALLKRINQKTDDLSKLVDPICELANLVRG